MYGKMKEHLSKTLAEIKEAGLYKEERLIESAQQAAITVKGKEVLNFCANNYLGLSNHPRLIAAAQKIMERRGYGMSSVRFICGTQDIHKELEAAISDYFKTEDTILYAACFDANGGVFEPLFTEEDAIISDSLNHASIIDGVRLCKAKRYRYANADMTELEKCLQEAQAQRFRIIVTDGVFSMDGNVAPMDKICDLAEKYDALVMVDEHPYSHLLLHRPIFVYGRCRLYFYESGNLRTRGHLYRYVGQSLWRCFRWFHHRTQGDYRPITPTQPSVLVLQLSCSGHHRCQPRSIQDVERKQFAT